MAREIKPSRIYGGRCQRKLLVQAVDRWLLDGLTTIGDERVVAVPEYGMTHSCGRRIKREKP